MTDLDAAALRSLTDRLAAGRGIAADALPAPLLDVGVEEVALAPGTPSVLVVRPRDWEELRHQEGAAGRPIPWWARLWASGLALAAAVAAAPPPPGARVLELGCGLGLPSVVAARAGARVLATDGEPDAVAFVAATLALNAVADAAGPPNSHASDATAAVPAAGAATTAAAERAEWTDDADRLVARGPFDLVLASDVLYRAEFAPALLALLPRLLAPSGAAWVADPSRAFATGFVDGARSSNAFATVETETHEGDAHQTDAHADEVRIHRLTARA